MKNCQVQTTNLVVGDGERLLLARRRKGLPAWKLAAQADIDPSTYSRLERGEREATPDQRLRLARVLGVEVETLFQRVTP
jgi:transcriptional regulator with XRE-family HTH domain